MTPASLHVTRTGEEYFAYLCGALADVNVILFPTGQSLSNISTYKLVLLTTDVRNIHIVGRRGQILQLLAREQVDGDQVDLGVTVLAGLGGRHVDDLAGAA